MAFEVIERGVFERKPALRSGQCTLDKTGKLTVLAADLEVVGIGGSVVTLADADTLRIALRAPRADEPILAYSLRPILRGKGRPSGRCAVNVARAIRRCGLEPQAVAGRREMSTKDDLLIVTLTDPTTENHAAHAAKQTATTTPRKAGAR